MDKGTKEPGFEGDDTSVPTDAELRLLVYGSRLRRLGTALGRAVVWLVELPVPDYHNAFQWGRHLGGLPADDLSGPDSRLRGDNLPPIPDS